jgi:hypothetical protein
MILHFLYVEFIQDPDGSNFMIERGNSGFDIDFNLLKDLAEEETRNKYKYSSNSNNEVDECSKSDFYKESISKRRPCVFKMKSFIKLKEIFEKVADNNFKDIEVFSGLDYSKKVLSFCERKGSLKKKKVLGWFLLHN